MSNGTDTQKAKAAESKAKADANEFLSLCSTIRNTSDSLAKFAGRFNAITGDDLLHHLVVFKTELGASPLHEGDAIIKEVDEVIKRLRTVGHFSPTSPSWSHATLRELVEFTSINHASGVVELFALANRADLAASVAGQRLLDYLAAERVELSGDRVCIHSRTCQPVEREAIERSLREAMNAEGYIAGATIVATTRTYASVLRTLAEQRQREREAEQKRLELEANRRLSDLVDSFRAASPAERERARAALLDEETLEVGA